MYDFIAKVIIIFVCKILFRVKYKNVEAVKKYKKCLICPNHSRVFDPIFLYPKIDFMYSMAKSELFRNKVMADFLTYHHAFPIDRKKVDAIGLKKAIQLLKDHKKIRLLLFPQGEVIKNKIGKGKVKQGALYIAAKLRVPIIPVYITQRPHYFSKVIVTFGEPFWVKQEVMRDRAILKEEGERLLEMIYQYSKEKAGRKNQKKDEKKY